MFSSKWSGRVATLFAVGLAVVLVSCGDGSNALGPNEGGVRFVLSSPAGAVAAPVAQAPGASLDGGPGWCDRDCHDGDHPMLQGANVTFSSILARNLDGVLVNVEMELPVTVDLVALRDTNEVTLPAGVLPPATYDQIVVVMTEVQVVTLDSTVITIAPPGGGWTAIVPVCRFDVADGATTTVGLKFDVARAFLWRNGRHHFEPGFSCEGAPSDGTGEGG
ncbi:MAG: DUF4382 domain-containing protein [Gemmatimonadales bacterium]|nr:DUF4382 domain-containing protein [Gemmatimonadales bacterium]